MAGMKDWIDIGPLEELPEGCPALRKAEGDRFVCVRRGGEVDALDDRCPHQGYPLSQGTLRGRVLTCAWHNWKFDLDTGNCTFGGESVRRYPTRIEGGRVLLYRALDPATEAARVSGSLRAALFDADVGRAVRDGLRLSSLAPDAPESADATPSVLPALGVMARDGAERAPWGFDHPLALLADLCSWAERGWIDGAEALALAAAAIGETNQARTKRDRPASAEDPAAQAAEVRTDLAEEKRDRAEATVRWLARSHGHEAALRALAPFAADHLFDYGHGTIFLAKARELAGRFPDAAEEVLASACVQLAWATAETSLPPFTATREALERLAKEPRAARTTGFDRAAYETEVLAGERPAVAATMARLADGCDPEQLLRAIGHAAAVRLSRFDSAWETRLEAEVGVLDVTHAVTFTESAIALVKATGDGAAAARLAVIGAGFVGKIRRADREDDLSTTHGVDLLDAAVAHNLPAALGALPELDTNSRRQTYARLAPFAALEVAARPILFAHTVKTTEALERLDAADVEADDVYLRALLVYLVPRRAERNLRRVATVARSFLRTGRPPEGLY
jgi:nitrite reductase/ring-hydroxylating ferredoxin subunit